MLLGLSLDGEVMAFAIFLLKSNEVSVLSKICYLQLTCNYVNITVLAGFTSTGSSVRTCQFGTIQCLF